MTDKPIKIIPEHNVTFKVIEETRKYSRAGSKYFSYKCELADGPWIGRIVFATRIEGHRFAVGGKYSGKIEHKKYQDMIFAEPFIRRDI